MCCFVAVCSLYMSTDGPQPEQIFTVVKISETKLAMKSGYGGSHWVPDMYL